MGGVTEALLAHVDKRLSIDKHPVINRSEAINGFISCTSSVVTVTLNKMLNTKLVPNQMSRNKCRDAKEFNPEVDGTDRAVFALIDVL
jgi:hypothetical protein